MNFCSHRPFVYGVYMLAVGVKCSDHGHFLKLIVCLYCITTAMCFLDRLVCIVMLLLGFRRMVDHHHSLTGIWIVSFSPQSVLSHRTFTTRKPISCDLQVAQHIIVATVLPLDQSELMPPHHPSDRDRAHFSSNQQQHFSRRGLLKSTHDVVAASIVATMTLSTNAYALQPRNEPLCATGLFEHFMEYKCTPIGDIQDEGIGKELTKVEEQTTNSLLSKLGIDNETSRFSEEKDKDDQISLNNTKYEAKGIN